MRTATVTALLTVAACGPRATAPAGRGPVDNAATPGAPDAEVACPAPGELAAWLRGHWQVAPDQRVEATCTPGRFPRAGWAIGAVVDESVDSAFAQWLVLAADDRAVIAQGERQPVAPWYRAEGGGLVELHPIDFDGDGTAELAHRDFVSHGGSHVGTYAVEGIVDGALRTLLTVVIDDGNDEGAAEDPADEYACSAQVELVEAEPPGSHQLVVIGTMVTGDPARSECVLGRTVYTLVGGAFTAATAR